MNVVFYLKVYGHLQRFNEDTAEWVRIETEHADLGYILAERGIPAEEVAFLVRNGKFMSWEDHVQEGDHIELVPPIEGG
jgi:sulfur carrier protein ThiS